MSPSTFLDLGSINLGLLIKILITGIHLGCLRSLYSCCVWCPKRGTTRWKCSVSTGRPRLTWRCILYRLHYIVSHGDRDSTLGSDRPCLVLFLIIFCVFISVGFNCDSICKDGCLSDEWVRQNDTWGLLVSNDHFYNDIFLLFSSVFLTRFTEFTIRKFCLSK